MKGSTEFKRYLMRFRKELHRVRWDDMHLAKLSLDAKNNRYKPRRAQLASEMQLQDF